MKKVDGYELDNCPFCKREAYGFLPCIMLGGVNGWYVGCENIDCNATGPVDLGKSGAAEKWNDRQEAQNV